MGGAIQPYDSRVVNHFGLHHDRVARLDDLICAVVPVGNHGRHPSWENQASILESHILRLAWMVKTFHSIALGGGCGASEAGKPAIRRIGNDGGPEAWLH